jgi:hypothetical protein
MSLVDSDGTVHHDITPPRAQMPAGIEELNTTIALSGRGWLTIMCANGTAVILELDRADGGMLQLTLLRDEDDEARPTALGVLRWNRRHVQLYQLVPERDETFPPRAAS